MSQNTRICAKCGSLCEYDDNAGYWFEDLNKGICGQCKGNLVNRFSAFFGLKSISCDKSGMIIEGPDVDKILSNIKTDVVKRTIYITTDKDFYIRTKQEAVPVEVE